MHNPLRPPPAPPGFGVGRTVPEEKASWFSRMVFAWLDPFLKVGFSRPLQKDDLWELPSNQLTGNASEVVERIFYARCPPEQRPAYWRASSSDAPRELNGKVSEGDKVSWDEVEQDQDSQRVTSDSPDAKYDSSLLGALHQVFFWKWWIAGLLYLGSIALQTTTPLLTRIILNWLVDSYAWYQIPLEDRPQAAKAYGISEPRGVGYGIGLAFALFVMQEGASLMTNYYMLMAMSIGMSVRTSVIGAIFRKSLRLSGRARREHSVGQITTMIAADAERLEHVTAYAHGLWVLTIQLIVGLALLIYTLGYSALVGLGVFIFSIPVQIFCAWVMFEMRKKTVVLTDQRVRLLTEVLQGIRFLKLYAWDDFYAQRLGGIRVRELQKIRFQGISIAGLISIMTVTPILAAVLSFITYALSGHALNVSIIFTSFQYFNIIRMPLTFLPLVLAASSDAYVAICRISKFFTAEELREPYVVDPSSSYAINAEGDFQWETTEQPSAKDTAESGEKSSKDNKNGDDKDKQDTAAETPKNKRSWFRRTPKQEDGVLPVTSDVSSDEKAESGTTKDKPFELRDLNLRIKRGAFVAIVGSIGSGKSSVLQALIGEMRRIRGKVIFSSSVAYVPQTAWIMNASLRENVTFGQPDDEKRVREVYRSCCLESDLRMLPNDEQTEIGEKGINLSGGQKARVSLARAAYSGADIILMDDTLSAVDAYVGQAILQDCILNGPLAEKTRVLVTHALHVLDKADYIYVMDQGVVVEQGTYKDLMSDSALFSRLMEEYGSAEQESSEKSDHKVKEQVEDPEGKREYSADAAPLMQAEERETGAVTVKTYGKYLQHAGGLLWAPTIMILLVLSQGALVANTLFLGFWTAESIPGFTQGDYMAVYGALGAASAVLSFLLCIAITFTALAASLSMFRTALRAVLKSPISFFDTTPMGRILSRFSGDQDVLDSQISMTAYTLLTTFSSVLGTVALVFYSLPYLGIIFAPMVIIYYFVALYYRRTSVETKRLDSIMRSSLYAAYSEALTGLSTLRAYAAQDQFIGKSDQGLDMENRAYYMTIAIQQWLATRLDLLGNILILGIALFGAGFRETVNPSKIGVVLSYALAITQSFSQLVAQYSTTEQNFNAVERVLHFTTLPSESAAHVPDDAPTSWPERGQIKFRNVELAYRTGLPPVLKGVSFTAAGGEKVGIVGRTGAGKSSLLQALFRTVDVQGGSVQIDGRDIRDVGLHTLRERLALVPQDNVLFKGTLRENLDPHGTRTEAELITVLQRTWLLPKNGEKDSAAEAKFSLDSAVSDEGSNYSAGEKQLLALCRALVKNSRIIVLDEATSNVDAETDAKIQRTIQTEFASSTLLCIAHRLNTIVYYDKILVMDAGRVAEFGTPLSLFDHEDSIFRSLCNEASLTRQDIVRIRGGAAATPDETQ